MYGRVLVAAAIASIGLLPVMGHGTAQAAVCSGTGVVNTPPLQYAILGIPNSGPLSGSVGGCTMSGSISGHCDRATGTMSMNGGSAAFTVSGNTITFSGPTWYGTGHWSPAVGQSCLPPSAATQFQLTLTATTAEVPPLPTLPAMPGGPPTNSQGCTSTPVHETETPVYSKVAVDQASSTTTWVCIRVSGTQTDDGIGGRLEISTGGGGLPNPGLPTTDAEYDECAVAPGNTAPGPRPLLRGQTGGVPYEVGIYQGPGASGTGEVWVCLQAGSAQHRVKVPTGGIGLPGLPGAVWRPDAGTPG